MGYEWIGYGMVLTVVFGLMGWILVTRLRTSIKGLLILALLLRVVGGFFRHYLLFAFYGGAGDAVRYFEWGRFYASQFSQLNFSSIFVPFDQFWGTHFIETVSGFVIWIIGPTMRGEFLLFGLFSLIGLLAIGFAVVRNSAHVRPVRYLFWLLLWPSLCYWPVSLGKDALVLLGLGVAFAGYMGQRGRIRWLPLVFGLAVIFAIRPQVAALITLAFIMAQWLSFKGEWTPARVAQGLVLLLCGAVVIWWGIQLVGITSFDLEGIQEYMGGKASTTADEDGGSIQAIGTRWYDAPMALVTTLFRPFLWEAHNVLALLSSLEMIFLWGVIWYRRRNVLAALQSWRRHRVLRFAFPFILMYSILLSMAVGNLGIIARQRIFIFPFLFLLVAWEPASVAVRYRRPRRREMVAS